MESSLKNEIANKAPDFQNGRKGYYYNYYYCVHIITRQSMMIVLATENRAYLLLALP